ncbi:unnamed protein product [marine sediment metagenome]|uniref:Uncharacterized protein n=1 Tax=marine sediment metagenome TaxID=412755 RepID=X1QG07_9ZZZZ
MGYGSPGGASTFVSLKDAPDSYTGSSKMVARVKSTLDGLEFGLPKLDITKFFDGSVDTPVDKDWEFETPLPFTDPYAGVFFSPLIKNVFDQLEVYVISHGFDFWKYNLKTKQWTELASPNYILWTTTGGGVFDRSLALSPDGLKLACVSEGGDDWRGGRRIEVYTIASDSWAASPQAPDVSASSTVVAGLVWEDNDTIWAWASRASAAVKTYCKCIKYTPTTTTWTQYATLQSGLTYCQPNGAGIVAGVVFGSYIGVVREYCKYTIAGDSYAFGSITAGRYFGTAADGSKLWYLDATTGRQGYLQVSDESEHDNIFAANPDKDTGNRFGVNSAADSIIADARNNAPQLMSCIGTGMYELDTLVTTNWTLVVVDKPNDGYAVTCLSDGRYVVALGYSVLLFEAATWVFYYPKAGTYTPIKLYSCPLEGG